MIAFRIADRRFPIFDGSGAQRVGGRWNSPGLAVIYASATFAGAVLELVVHGGLGHLPKNHAVIEITVPDGVAVESVAVAELPRWNAPDCIVSRAFGDRWLTERRTEVLLVPSMVTHGREHNLLFNPDHPDFKLIQVSKPQRIAWDRRLFHRPVRNL